MWKVEYTKKFLKELASLPTNIQSRIELIVFRELEAENPFELRYLKKMKGYKNKSNIKLELAIIGLV
nr:type II toxin-antitoxin system RelE/ParE family toxin [Pleurocapsa sp. FMAR1]